MSFARFGPNSDVYVYGADDYFICMHQTSISFECTTPTEMIAHLLWHRGAGDRVPDCAFDELEQEQRIPRAPIGEEP